MTGKKKTNQVLVTMNDSVYERLLKFKEDNSLDHNAEAIRLLIIQATTVPDYVKAQLAKSKRVALTPEERAEQQAIADENKKKAKDKVFMAGKERICHALGGFVNADGYCEYPRYEEQPGEQIVTFTEKMPLEELADDAVDYQYLTHLAKSPAAKKERIISIMNKNTK